MEPNVRVECAACHSPIIVLPAELYTAVGRLAGIEGEIQFREIVSGQVAQTGDRLAVADAERRYTCPVCGRHAQLPAIA